MPSPRIARYKLCDVTSAVDDKVRGNGQPSQIFFKPRIGLQIKLIEKEIRDVWRTKLTRRQTDVVNHQQGDITVGWTLVKVRRGTQRNVHRGFKPSVRVEFHDEKLAGFARTKLRVRLAAPGFVLSQQSLRAG
jgi:hypothetical protein